tara:strand:- start:7622 stop:8224 length:603 start_codon:yes stop_codon:yes gene_type:complete
MLSLKKINKNFLNPVLKDFSYDFKLGNSYRISGKNGVGKTTLLKIVKGIYIQDDGDIYIGNKTLNHNDVSYIDNDFRSFIHRLSVDENLRYFNSLHGQSAITEESKKILHYFDVENLKDLKFSDLSQGQMQIISIIRGIVNKPKILLLDECISALDKGFILKFEKWLMNYLHKGNRMVIFTSHHKNVFDALQYIEVKIQS